jgi:hypothetical protein
MNGESRGQIRNADALTSLHLMQHP